MAKAIKGLTIQIDGETKGLDKALDSVNKQSKNINTELRQVEKLLKFNPGNAELIAQQQKLLGEQVETTADKLGQLKNAQEEVDRQFAEGKIPEDKYRAFQREIVETESKLQHYEKKLKSVSDEHTTLSQKVTKAGDSIKNAGSKIAKAGDAFKPVSIAAAGLLTGVVANVEATKEYREEMGKLETAFVTNGHSVEDAEKVYSDFYSVLGEEDRSVEAVNHLAKLTTSQEELANWTTIATGVYATFGDSLPIEGLTEAANETAKTGELTGVLTDALTWAGISEDEFKEKLAATNTEKERSELITETLNGLYGEAAEKYKEVNAETIAANEAQGKMNESMADFAKVTQPIVTKVMTALASILEKVADWVKNLDEETLKMILTIAAVVAGITPLLIIIGKVISVIGVITSALPVLGAAFAALTWPIAAAIAAVAAVIAIGVALYKNWDWLMDKASQLGSYLSSKFSAIKDSIINPINSAIDVLKNIDLREIGRNIIEGLIDGIGSMAYAVKDKVEDIASSVTGGISKFLGIQSPSKVMEEMGEFTGEGFAIGIGNSLKNIAKQARIMADIPQGLSGSQNSNTNTNNSFVVNAVIREESDVKKVANELYSLQQRSNRGRGIVAL